MDTSSGDLDRFRVLIIGRRNAGKTTILEKMTGSEEGAMREIRDKEGRLVDDSTLLRGGVQRGLSVIDYEITYPSSPRLVFHDSRGIEAGAEPDSHGKETGDKLESSKLRVEYIQKFIDDRAQQTRTEDQLHAIWFCMPMDNPRVPSDDFELAFLEKINRNVPVIAVLTKYEALVDRVKGESKEKQAEKKDILNYAKVNILDPLKNVTYKPAAIVQTHHKGEGCELLTKKTFESIKDETLATIFAMAQQNSMRVACELTFKQTIEQPILSRLKMATKVDNTADLYEDFIDKGLKYLPFWNLIGDDDATQSKTKIICAIEKWLKPNSMDILVDGFYINYVAFVCLIGCLCCNLQHFKTPWEHIDDAIEKLKDKETRSDFIEKLEALHHKYKHGFKELCLKLADLVVDSANML